MKNTIYYFTGTGNTLAVSRNLADHLGDTELVSIPSVIWQDWIVSEADVVGIAFPVYFLNVPDIIREFVQKLRFSGKPYIFGLATCGEQAGGALFSLKFLLEEKGSELAAGFALVMPENFIGPINLMGDAPHRHEKFAAVQGRIPEITAIIRERREMAPEGSDSAVLRFGGFITKTLMTSVYQTPRRFYATERCNQCRTCERICPARNITLEKNTVAWGTTCTQCYACIHWCPREAIEIGKRTRGKKRYHHPDVTLRDMLIQRTD